MSEELKVLSKILINAPKEKVWDVLTNPEKTKLYMFNCEVNSNWTPGGEITWKGNYQGYEAFQKGNILEINPGQRVKYSTFDPNYGYEDVPENYIHVLYELKPYHDQTELTTEFSNFNGSQERRDHTATGWDMVLQKIKDVAES